MPHGIVTRPGGLRHVAAVVGFSLAALPAAASAVPLTTSPMSALPDATSCGADEVGVVVDYNELGGETRVACAPEGGTAAEIFADAGFQFGTANAPGMQGFVCTVGGIPEHGRCGQGTAYWSLWWSADATDWVYAGLGATQLELEPGNHVGFAWHEGNGAARPPDVALPGNTGADPQHNDEVVTGAPEQTTEGAGAEDAGSGGSGTWLLVGGAVVVLGAAVAVPVRRRKRPQP